VGGVGGVEPHEGPSVRGKEAEEGTGKVGGVGTEATGGRVRVSERPEVEGLHQFPGPEPPERVISRGNQVFREKALQYKKPLAVLCQ